MALLDRFKAHPKHRHPDPAVRLAFVTELPIDEREQLAAIAHEDEDPRVRRAAAAKLMDPAALAGVARDDGDEGVRAQAMDMLRDIALEAFEGAGEAESLAAVNALSSLGDSKTLAIVAKSAAREGVARAALGHVADARALGSIARHGSFEPLRAEALARVQDHGEILAVAMNSEFKDTALAALDRVSGREDLERVAERAKNKSSAKRARTTLREMDERAAAEAAAVAASAVAAAAAADVAAVSEADALRVQIEETAQALQRLQDADRAEAARKQDAERAEADAEAARVRAEQQAAERARAEAEAQKEHERRQARAAELAAQAEADAKTRREALSRVQQLAARVEPLAAKADLSLKAGERALHDIRAMLADVPPLPSRHDYDEVTRRLKAAQAALTPKVVELREAEDWKRFANAGIQEQLCARMEALRALEDPEALAREIRDLQQEWRQVADVPRAQGEALWRRFKAAHDAVWPRCEAHFAAQNEARAANLAAKVTLCERAEALAESRNWIQTAEAIKGLQAEWKTIGPVTRGQEKAIWDRFRVACDRFFTRRHEDLAQRKSMWAENYAKKEALAVQAEALAQSTEWETAASAIKRLQAEWKGIGPVKKTRSEAIWQRFRAACDLFFSRYAQRHDIAKAERVAAREAICAELEALAQSPVSSLQSPVTALSPDASEPASAAQAGEPAPDQPPATSHQPPEDLGLTVRGLRSKWQREIAARGVDRERSIALDDRFQAAFNAVLARWPDVFNGTDLDPNANRVRMEALVKRVEDLAQSLAGPSASGDAALSPTTRLAAMLKEALAANTIGGKVDETSRWRAAQEDVRQAQASWARLGPVAEATRRPLADRFNRACRRVTEGAGGTGKPGGAGR
jgi:Domain of Unknown Function (DUF349)